MLQQPLPVARTCLLGGTTQVLLVGETAVVIASDRAQHVGNAGRAAQDVRKIDRVGRLIVGISGTTAVKSEDGRVLVDLQESVPPSLSSFNWVDVNADTEEATRVIGVLLAPLEARRFGIRPDLIPGVTVLLAGIAGDLGAFGARIRFHASYVPDGQGHRLSFGEPSVSHYRAAAGVLECLVQTRLTDVESRARDLFAGRAVDPRYPVLGALRQYSINELLLRAVAQELVQVTADLDDHIGGGIDIESLSSGRDPTAEPPDA